MASVTMILRLDKKNKKGEAPVYFRLIKHRKVAYMSSGIKVRPGEWDDKNKKVRPKHRNSGRMNAFLYKKYSELTDRVLEQESHCISLPVRQIKSKLFGKDPGDFISYAEKTVEKYRTAGRIGTHDKNRAIINKLKAYLAGKSVTFYDVTPEFLSKYEQHLRGTLKNSTNTINKDFKFIRKVFNDAIRDDIIEYETTPFRKVQLRTERTERAFLTEDELKLIEEYPAVVGSKMELHRDMFVFSSCTGGIRISDMLMLRWRNFDGSHVRFTVKKTGAQLSIKVPDKGLKILEKYRPSVSNSSLFIFGMLPQTLNIEDPVELDNAISRGTAYVNKNLRYIAEAVGIEKKCSFHTSRHSFAVQALQRGVTIDKVSKILAHHTIRQTQAYAKIVDEELDKAMEAFNN